MKILHVVALIHASTGGPAVSVTRLASEQAKLGHEVTLACLDYTHLGPQVAAPGVRVVSVKGNVFAVRGRGWSPRLRRVVMEEAKKADIVHNHGLWMWPNAYAREGALKAGKPLIISPRGMLEAWSLGRSKLRKAVAGWLFEKKNLQSAAMFHATADAEKRSIEKAIGHGLTRIRGRISPGGGADRTGGECSSPGIALGPSAVPGSRNASSNEDNLRLKNLKLKPAAEVPIVVAPNGVDLPDLAQKPGRQVLEEKFPALRDRRWIVFMSRLHPKKGVDVLLRAWRKLQNVEHEAYGIRHTAAETKRLKDEETKDSPMLVLAGPDLIGYGKDVERMVLELGLEDSVVITGELQGEAKECLLANASVFVLPSYSENFGIVVAEAMSWSRPVIASTGTPWKEAVDVGAGWWVKPEEGELVRTMREALGKRPEELDAMGAKGRTLVAERYTWAAPAAKLLGAYEELLVKENRWPRIDADRHG